MDRWDSREENIDSGTPVNAAAAAKILTIGTNPVEAATVTIGTVTYKFRVDIGVGAAALGVLSVSDLPHEGDTITIGTTTYTITATVNAAFKVLLGATAEATIDNLVLAINLGAGSGTNYGTGTTVHPTVSAAKSGVDELTVTAKTFGFAGNNIATTQVANHCTWVGAKASGGIDPEAANDVKIGLNTEGSIDNLVLAVMAGLGEGTDYGTGTVANTLASAAKSAASTLTATALIKGVNGNTIAVGETLADGSWAGTAILLSGGVDGTAGVIGQVFYDSNYLYMCIALNGITGTNWRRISLGSAY